MKTTIFLLAFLLTAICASAQTTPPRTRDRLTTAQKTTYDASTAGAEALLKSLLDERDALQTRLAAAQTALTAEKAKTTALETQLSAAVATTKSKAEIAAIAAIRAVQ